MSYRIDPDEIRRAWELFIRPGQVTEMRALNAGVIGEYRGGTFSGYFSDCEAMITACQKIGRASGVYFVPNAVNPDLLARSYNKARIVGQRDPLTTDRDIIRRRWLLIDVDAKRPVGVSATAAEKAAAEGLIVEIDYHLWGLGFPPGVICDSGNGAHLMIPIDLPVDDGKFCRRVLQGLARDFDTPAATVDVTVFNASRIWKLPGTMSCKGDNCPEIGREWRMANIRQVCIATEGDRNVTRSCN